MKEVEYYGTNKLNDYILGKCFLLKEIDLKEVLKSIHLRMNQYKYQK